MVLRNSQHELESGDFRRSMTMRSENAHVEMDGGGASGVSGVRKRSV